ncbi:conserved hypothetical protein [Aspergillus terreus NIH2624]|uniref:Aminotransferase class I/classII large domain-containing protein n=1 Tax=Aspergillus terreus (strain NIH 2624 / FGSC A1156) TaxID=341663 RepID=Q0D087_ASPTN|nr:uncharacterized protein ATEG_00647 [Aspergillus terreus NIH2624]EAU39293.1 conserved hypothetical protein [Aspergillus terreus NIH2624]
MNTPSSSVDLFRGWPNPALLPTAALADAFATTLTTPDQCLLYGPDQGHEPLRQHIAQWLTSFYQPCRPVTSDRICITGGASQNLACVFQVFTDPAYTQYVWLVAPTYHLASRIINDAGFAGRMKAVPQTASSGVDVDFLRSALISAEREGGRPVTYKPQRPWAKIYRHVIYATPTFSNPSTVSLSRANREALVRVAREFDALIVTDDVYDFLQWSADPTKPLSRPDQAHLPRLVDVDRYLDGGPKDEWGNTLSNGSFSKLIGPGARTGWAEGTAQLAYGLSQTGSSRSGGAPSHVAAAAIAELFPSGLFQRHLVEVLQPQYAQRYYRLMDAIREHLVPLGITVPMETGGIVGGYFVWIQLPKGMRASELVTRLGEEESGVVVAGGNLFRVEDATAGEMNDFDEYVRLCFAWETEENLVEGVRRLSQYLKKK